MKLQITKILAEKLIKRYCSEYTFKFDNAKVRFGYCNYSKKSISLSTKLVRLNNEKEVKNVILHEIAHALTPKQHHNKIWKLKAISIGCDGKRCYNTKIINSVKGKYIYQCPMCKRKFNRHRKIKQIRSCGLCCNKYNNGNYSSDFNLIYLGKEK